MNQFEYIILMLEIDYLSKTLAGLRMNEQKHLGHLASPKGRHDIHSLGKLPKIREDMKNISAMLEVQTEIANAQIAATYNIEFKSLPFKSLKKYAEQINTIQSQGKQVQSEEGNLSGQEVPQQEGSKPLEVPGPEHESNLTASKGGSGGVSESLPD